MCLWDPHYVVIKQSKQPLTSFLEIGVPKTQQSTFLRVRNIFNTFSPKVCLSQRCSAISLVKKWEGWKKLIEGAREGYLRGFFGCLQYGCRGVIYKFWTHVYLGRGGPSFAYFCRNYKFMILNTIFFWDKLIIYTQKSLFTPKTNTWTPCCKSQNQIKSLLIFAFQLFLKILS